MPLPNDWDGVFYSTETQGDLLFDLSAEDFIALLADRPDAPFLYAGAMFDLLFNEQKERFKALFKAAAQARPDQPWVAVIGVCGLAIQERQSGTPQNRISRLAYNTVARYFDGGVTVTTLG